jgi:hypothetical protein
MLYSKLMTKQLAEGTFQNFGQAEYAPKNIEKI